MTTPTRCGYCQVCDAVREGERDITWHGMRERETDILL
jgi:hypothetical protein